MDPAGFPEFQPHPLLRGGHAQTIFGAYLRSPIPVYSAVRRSVKLEDGDFIVLHDDAPHGGLVLPESRWTPPPAREAAPAGGPAAGRPGDSVPPESPLREAGREAGLDRWHPASRVVLMLHGLGGSYRSGYMPRLAARLNGAGFRTFRMDLRGWGAGQQVARKTAHAGMSHDALAALRTISRLCPHSPITLVGYSLGGNLALKLAGEVGAAPPSGLDSVVVVAPPINLVQCAENIRKGFNWIYDRTFIHSLRRNLRQRRAILPDDGRLHPNNLPDNLYDFDDRITAPLNGFADAEDYYRRASSGPLLGDIRIPTLIITAQDDPIIPPRMFENVRLSSDVRLHVTRHGGHLGFIGRAGNDPDHRWLDWRVVQAIEHWDRQSREIITSGPPAAPPRSAAPPRPHVDQPLPSPVPNRGRSRRRKRPDGQARPV